ncbi:hypothetical protein C2S52_013541, partial [Perilla frutescens var. hirtella]
VPVAVSIKNDVSLRKSVFKVPFSVGDYIDSIWDGNGKRCRYVFDYAVKRCVEKGFDLMNEMKKCGIRANGFVYNVLIGGLSKEMRVGDAQKLFDEMSNRNVAPK